jgi:probable F420-dependent oxidoreductase
MKFGVRLPNSGPLASRNNIIQVAEAAEDLGYDSIWVHDHLLWRTQEHRGHLSAGSAEALSESQKPNLFESVTTLAYLAGRTQSINLGFSALVLPLRSPLFLAKELANIDVLSEGRIIVGVAPGAPNITRPEFDAVQVPYEERGTVTDEYIRVLRKVWSEPLPSFSGNYVKFEKVQIFPKPSQNLLKILIAGGERGISERALRRVLELGDGWIPAYLTPEEIGDGVRKIGQQSTGRKFLIAHEMFALVDPNSETAKRLASKSLQKNFSSFEEGMRRSLVGSPDDLVAKLEKYSKAGVNVTELKFVYADIPRLTDMMKIFAKDILPSF